MAARIQEVEERGINLGSLVADPEGRPTEPGQLGPGHKPHANGQQALSYVPNPGEIPGESLASFMHGHGHAAPPAAMHSQPASQSGLGVSTHPQLSNGQAAAASPPHSQQSDSAYLSAQSV